MMTRVDGDGRGPTVSVLGFETSLLHWEGLKYALLPAINLAQISEFSLVICTLGDDAKVNMEVEIEMGKGFVLAEENKDADAPVGA